MNKKIFAAVALLFGLAGVLTAQDDMEQRPTGGMSPDMIEAKPEGGFSKSVGGKWNCGDLGTMTLTDTQGKVKGTYTKNKGTVTGTVKGDTFTGDWKESTGKKGYFTLKTSIRTKTTKPTHLEGTKTVAAKGAKVETVKCKK